MTNKPSANETAALLALLAAVQDALTLPYDTPDYEQRLSSRARPVRVVLAEAQSPTGATALFNTAYLRTQIAEEEAQAAEREKNRCRRCLTPFDPTDTAFDGRARYKDSTWCRWCTDKCHDGGAEHVCQICDPARYGGGQ
ncbi:hypothetical protein ACWD4O_10290 [Streptomyces sp. NPDC002623]